jgi:hypothetical protein
LKQQESKLRTFFRGIDMPHVKLFLIPVTGGLPLLLRNMLVCKSSQNFDKAVQPLTGPYSPYRSWRRFYYFWINNPNFAMIFHK